jgi:hypothetical protein
VTVQLADYAAVPQSGVLINSTDNAVYVGRVNFLREEPGGGLNRFFVCDLNGRLYILDKSTKQFATYLDFQRNTAEAPSGTGLFPAFTRAAGYANGLVTFQFDPEYRNGGSPHYGKFYPRPCPRIPSKLCPLFEPRSGPYPGSIRSRERPQV